MSGPGTVVLVHGGFVGGSGWQEVYRLLKNDGYSVSVVQNPGERRRGAGRAAPRTARTLGARDQAARSTVVALSA
jgi:hypothetical protein